MPWFWMRMLLSFRIKMCFMESGEGVFIMVGKVYNPLLQLQIMKLLMNLKYLMYRIALIQIQIPVVSNFSKRTWCVEKLEHNRLNNRMKPKKIEVFSWSVTCGGDRLFMLMTVLRSFFYFVTCGGRQALHWSRAKEDHMDKILPFSYKFFRTLWISSIWNDKIDMDAFVGRSRK